VGRWDGFWKMFRYGCQSIRMLVFAELLRPLRTRHFRHG